jgi:hypothetical protein
MGGSSEMFRHFVVAVAVLGLSATGAVAAPADESRIPLRLESIIKRNTDLWIDASDLLDAQGKVKSQRLDSIGAVLIPQLLASPAEGGCLHVEEVFADFVNPPKRDSLESASRGADFIAEGIVTGQAYGFYSATPGEMLRVDVSSVWSGISPKSYYYVFIPVGTFNVGSTRICKTDRRYPDPPVLGDRMVLFGQRTFLAGNVLETIDEAGFIRVRPGGRLVMPDRYKAAAVSDEHELRERLDVRQRSRD